MKNKRLLLVLLAFAVIAAGFFIDPGGNVSGFAAGFRDGFAGAAPAPGS